MTNKIKIIEVIADSEIGGGPKHVLGLLKNLNKEKFEVLLIAPSGWLTTRAAQIFAVGIRQMKFGGQFDLSALSRLKKNIAEFRASENPFGPIIIHAHGPRAGWFCRRALRSAEKFIYTEHIWNQNYHLRNPLRSIWQKLGIKMVCRRADEVFAVSKSVKKFLSEKLKIKAEKIIIIPNAIEIVEIEKKRHDGFLVGTIGSLYKQKGQIYLIRAFARVVTSLPKARLEIVGDGPEKAELSEEIRRLGLEAKVQLLGRQEKPAKFLKNWDLFVLPSLSETFGLVLLEAMSAGVPIIASKVGGISEIIKSGENGILVPPADPEKLAKAINYFLVEKNERQKLAAAALLTLKKNYDWSKIIVEIEKNYLKLVK